MQLIGRPRAALIAGAIVVGLAGAAHADGELSMRGVYYKERATRVIQPMMDGRFEVGDDGVADAHALVDAITSASIAAGAADEPFSETRYELGAGYAHQLTRLRVGGQGRVSHEPDYTSLYAGVRGELELADKNVVVGAGGGIGHDWISNAGAQTPMSTLETHALDTVLGSLSLSQLLGRNAVAAVTYDVSHLSGFQANIYRSVMIAVPGQPNPRLASERHPETRTRHAVAGTMRVFLPSTSTTAIGSYRFYRDDWDVLAHTPELRVVQDAGARAQVALRYRYHWQHGADFYRTSYPSDDPMLFPYLSDDVKLSDFSAHTYGIKFSATLGVLGFTGKLGDIRGELVLEYVDQNNRFGNAGIAHAGLTFPIEY